MTTTSNLFRGLGGILFSLFLGGAALAEPSTQAESLHAIQRLSFGPAPGDLERVMQLGVHRYIDEQLDPQRLVLPSTLTLMLGTLQTTSLSQSELIARYREASQAAKNDKESGKKMRQDLYQTLTLESGEERLFRALQSPRQLEEVMVEFWFNHFNVFSGKGLDRALIENYEREAIRPFVFGKFRELLGATAHHPAMLFYLDNWLSTGPGYTKGRRPARAVAKHGGLNENYARELMELHTLGVNGGYSQTDVTELARMLTGWTIDQRHEHRSSAFYFDDSRHDQGTKQWLGRTIANRGQAEGERALDALGVHPSTARHISFKLAQYFVADEPPVTLVDQLTAKFLSSDGDIHAVLATLLHSQEFGNASTYGIKFKTPYRYVLSAIRASGLNITGVRPLLSTLYQLGMPLYGCPTPDGYKNTEVAWLNPDAVTRRVNFAVAFASGKLPFARPMQSSETEMRRARSIKNENRNGSTEKFNPDWATKEIEPNGLLETLGSSITVDTRRVISQADSKLHAALILGSPDFMRY